MSLLPAYLNARKRKRDLEFPVEQENEPDSRPVFELVPPSPPEELESSDEPGSREDEPEDVAAPSRNVHPIDAGDLRRLSIDNDGRLYWDGKPVEVRRRILMSRAQVIGAAVTAGFVAIAALATVVQASVAARDWACRLGWTSHYCLSPESRPNIPTDIPA
jgi:hypothetical protein